MLVVNDETGDRHYEISVYSDAPATDTEIAAHMRRLMIAFPNQDPAFWALLTDSVRRNSLSRQRLADAVNHIIDTNSYPTLKIAEVIKFDKRKRVYTYADVLRFVDQGAKFSDFTCLKDQLDPSGRPFWGKNSEL